MILPFAPVFVVDECRGPVFGQRAVELHVVEFVFEERLVELIESVGLQFVVVDVVARLEPRVEGQHPQGDARHGQIDRRGDEFPPAGFERLGGADVAALGCDFYAFSGHKLYGPTGIGVLYGRRELLDAMPPFLYGGDMVDRVSFGGTTYAPLPLKFEAGTANFVGAIGLGEAIRYLEQFDPAEIEAYERELLGYAAERLSAVDGLRIYGATPDKCAIVSFTVEGTHPYDVGMILDKLGIAVRTGQHCAEPVMTHYGVPGMCRASLAMYNTRGEIDALAAGVERAVRMLR
mgnify:FL=1